MINVDYQLQVGCEAMLDFILYLFNDYLRIEYYNNGRFFFTTRVIPSCEDKKFSKDRIMFNHGIKYFRTKVGDQKVEKSIISSNFFSF